MALVVSGVADAPDKLLRFHELLQDVRRGLRDDLDEAGWDALEADIKRWGGFLSLRQSPLQKGPDAGERSKLTSNAVTGRAKPLTEADVRGVIAMSDELGLSELRCLRYWDASEEERRVAEAHLGDEGSDAADGADVAGGARRLFYYEQACVLTIVCEMLRARHASELREEARAFFRDRVDELLRAGLPMQLLETVQWVTQTLVASEEGGSRSQYAGWSDRAPMAAPRRAFLSDTLQRCSEALFYAFYVTQVEEAELTALLETLRRVSAEVSRKRKGAGGFSLTHKSYLPSDANARAAEQASALTAETLFSTLCVLLCTLMCAMETGVPLLDRSHGGLTSIEVLSSAGDAPGRQSIHPSRVGNKLRPPPELDQAGSAEGQRLMERLWRILCVPLPGANSSADGIANGVANRSGESGAGGGDAPWEHEEVQALCTLVAGLFYRPPRARRDGGFSVDETSDRVYEAAMRGRALSFVAGPLLLGLRNLCGASELGALCVGVASDLLCGVASLVHERHAHASPESVSSWAFRVESRLNHAFQRRHSAEDTPLSLCVRGDMLDDLLAALLEASRLSDHLATKYASDAHLATVLSHMLSYMLDARNPTSDANAPLMRDWMLLLGSVAVAHDAAAAAVTASLHRSLLGAAEGEEQSTYHWLLSKLERIVQTAEGMSRRPADQRAPDGALPHPEFCEGVCGLLEALAGREDFVGEGAQLRAADGVVRLLFRLLVLPLGMPLDLKGAAFKALASFAKHAPLAERIWDYLEEAQVLPTLPPPPLGGPPPPGPPPPPSGGGPPPNPPRAASRRSSRRRRARSGCTPRRTASSASSTSCSAPPARSTPSARAGGPPAPSRTCPSPWSACCSARSTASTGRPAAASAGGSPRACCACCCSPCSGTPSTRGSSTTRRRGTPPGGGLSPARARCARRTRTSRGPARRAASPSRCSTRC